MNKKTIALLLALSIMPTLSLANYEPDANQWQWYESTPRVGYYISKQSPVVKISETADTLTLRGYVQTVYATPKAGVKFTTRGVQVVYNKATGERLYQHISLIDYDENRNIVASGSNFKPVIMPPGTLGWRVSQALLDNYNAQARQ